MTTAITAAALAAVTKPPPDDKVSPGLLGFLVTFALVLATVLLMRSMVGHLRKVRYSPGPGDQPSSLSSPVTPPPQPGAGPQYPRSGSQPDERSGNPPT